MILKLICEILKQIKPNLLYDSKESSCSSWLDTKIHEPLSSFSHSSFRFLLLCAHRAAKPSRRWKFKAFIGFSNKSVMCPCIIDEEYRVGWLWNIGQRRCAWSNPRLHSTEALTCHCLLLQHLNLGPIQWVFLFKQHSPSSEG